MFAQCRVSSMSAALLLVAIVATSNLAAAQFTNFTLKPLPYDYVALEPLMGNETVTLHHDVHGAASLNTLNAAIVNTTLVNLVQGGASEEDLITVVRQSWQNGAPIKGVFNGAAQAWNHIHFWDGMKANPTAAPNTPPPGPLSDAINAAYGTFDNFTVVFKQAGLDRFGSGWVWLLYNGSCALSVKSTPNGENYIAYNNGSVSILGLDVWEHSYYLDVRNNRAAYIDNFMKLVNWDVVSARYPADPAVCQTNAAPQSVSSMGTMAPPAAPPVAPTNAAGTVAVAAKLLLAIAALVVLVAL